MLTGVDRRQPVPPGDAASLPVPAGNFLSATAAPPLAINAERSAATATRVTAIGPTPKRKPSRDRTTRDERSDQRHVTITGHASLPLRKSHNDTIRGGSRGPSPLDPPLLTPNTPDPATTWSEWGGIGDLLG
ncbi:conserved hypothetical protein [Frankia sp. Hr75.2]|nr:conserved hypothetical protein [Frankia sp. Hr75.2]